MGDPRTIEEIAAYYAALRARGWPSNPWVAYQAPSSKPNPRQGGKGHGEKEDESR